MSAREIEIKGSTAFSFEFPNALELMKAHKINTKALINLVTPLSKIQDAFNEQLRARKYIEVLIAP
jgi:threonine dehydrogenase-like Zn-dependent dehydrogenase